MTRSAKGGRSAVRLIGSIAVIAGLGVSATACSGSSSSPSTGSSDGTPTSGGNLNVLLDSGFSGGWATGLDPATSNTTGANIPQNAAIFGGLFTLEADSNGSNARIVPNQAASYSWSSDEKTLTIKLRSGITFSDGTPFNAQAVVWNWIRELDSKSAGAPTLALATSTTAPSLSDAFMSSLYAALPADVDKAKVASQLGAIQAVDDTTVTLALSAVNGSLVDGFPTSELNLIASPTAYAKLGKAAFAEAPVGAGPFVVTSDKYSDRLELKKNPTYFKSGLPYLDTLNFQAVAGDQVAYQTLLAGQGDAIEGLSSVALIEQANANSGVQVMQMPPTSPYVVQLNTRIAPFNDIKAREAIYYATDFAAINKGLFKGKGEMSQSFMASGDLFKTTTVPGYRTYDLAKAKALVKELGGLQVQLETTDIVTARSVMTALQTQWQAAGIQVTITAAPLGDVITKFIGGQWQSFLQTAGAWDPSTGIGVAIRFGSTSPFSGAPLPDGTTSAADAIAKGKTTELDDMLAKAIATTDTSARLKTYNDIAKYISDNAYAPFGMAFSPAQVVKKGVHGPGLTTPIPALSVNSGVLYDRVWVSSSK